MLPLKELKGVYWREVAPVRVDLWFDLLQPPEHVIVVVVDCLQMVLPISNVEAILASLQIP